MPASILTRPIFSRNGIRRKQVEWRSAIPNGGSHGCDWAGTRQKSRAPRRRLVEARGARRCPRGSPW